MKKLILLLGLVAFGFTTMESCSKKTECVCTDADGVSVPIDLSANTTRASRKMACDAYHLSMKSAGGKCKLK